jgi:hypothetical protein
MQKDYLGINEFLGSANPSQRSRLAELAARYAVASRVWA